MKDRWGDRALGWLLSAGIHLILLLGTALVFIEQLIAYDVTVYPHFICGMGDVPPRLEPEVPRDLFERKGAAPDDGELFSLAGDSTFSPQSMDAWFPGLEGIPRYDVLVLGSTVPAALAMPAERPERSFEDRRKILWFPKSIACSIGGPG